jgi:hypothetical protein
MDDVMTGGDKSVALACGCGCGVDAVAVRASADEGRTTAGSEGFGGAVRLRQPAE